MTTSFRRSIVASLLALLLAPAALAQGPGPGGPRPALVPCEPSTTGPCATVATSVADILGVWKQFLGNPMLQAPGGMGFIRHRADGSFSLADTAANTATPYGNYPRGRVSFDGEVMTMEVEGDAVPPECRRGSYQVQVIRHAGHPVALYYQPIEDDCAGRTSDMLTPVMWVGE
jgi:hypothetical protein